MKKLILGLVIGIFLGMSTNAFAAIGDTIQATFAQFNYVVNGETKTLDSPVLVYEGTSYVRTTQISNLLGYDVTYKKDSRTIEFANPDVVVTPTGNTVTEDTYVATPSPTTAPTPLPTDAEGNVLPTPTPDPNASPEPSPEPSAEPSPTITPSPTSTPAPSNVAQCQAIRDSYNLQIFNINNSNTNGKAFKVTQLQNQMSSALSAAGC